MVEKLIPEEMLKTVTFEQFQEECKHLSEMNDDGIKETFKDDPRTPEVIREEYKKLADTVTAYEFNSQKQKFALETLKTEGNNLFREGKYAESLAKYNEALNQMKKMKEIELEEIETTLILNIAIVYIKMNEPDKAIVECKKVRVIVMQ